VTTGAMHTCAISNGRRAYCWGANNWGQLGTGNTNSSLLPVPVAGALASL
jgi:alpha-tubulin suppressor-like RCC1 family protein